MGSQSDTTEQLSMHSRPSPNHETFKLVHFINFKVQYKTSVFLPQTCTLWQFSLTFPLPSFPIPGTESSLCVPLKCPAGFALSVALESTQSHLNYCTRFLAGLDFLPPIFLAYETRNLHLSCHFCTKKFKRVSADHKFF